MWSRSSSRFADRADAGRRLAPLLEHLRGPDLVVLGLPRGGVPVAFEVARALGAPLDVIVVRKLGFPFHAELAMGAIGEGGSEVLDESLVAFEGTTEQQVREVERRERAALEDRVRRLRSGTGINFDPHWLRHTYATGLLRSGVPVEVVSCLLGHASVATTSATYAHLTVADTRAALTRAGVLTEDVS